MVPIRTAPHDTNVQLFTEYSLLESLPGSGNGAKSMLTELAHSDAFAQCQVKKAFKAVCLREPGDADDRSQLNNMVSSFTSGGYNMKTVFAEAADYCKGN